MESLGRDFLGIVGAGVLCGMNGKLERSLVKAFRNVAVCTENLIRVDDVMESPKLAE